MTSNKPCPMQLASFSWLTGICRSDGSFSSHSIRTSLLLLSIQGTPLVEVDGSVKDIQDCNAALAWY